MYNSRTWKCQDCGKVNSEDVYPCPSCMSSPQKRQKDNIQHDKKSNKCNFCTFQNPEYAIKCVVCNNQLQKNWFELPLKIKKSVLTCKECKQENSLENEICVYCQADLYESEKLICDICLQQVKQTLFAQHHKGCLLSSELIKKQHQQILERQRLMISKDLEECIHCRQKFDPSIIKQHYINCREKQLINLQIDEKTRMTKLQIQAIHYMNQKSQRQHNQTRGALQARIKKLGFTIEDLNNLQYYIQNYAPIIIHIHVSKHMEFFIKDTHYRSQFETNKSSGSLSRPSRIQWEDRMFDKKYSKAKDFERVKYGVINFTNDPKGVGACSGYGGSYFLLKDHVRERCTFTDKDSSSADASIATFRYCFKILSKMNDAELKAAFDASKAKEVSSQCIASYKQMQIHGPIEFNKDIQTIYVNKNEVKDNKKLLDMVYLFSNKNKVQHDFF